MANVGTLDRIARFVVGLALLVVAFAVPAAEAALGVAWWLLPIAGVRIPEQVGHLFRNEVGR